MTRSATMSSSIRARIRPGLTPVQSPVHGQQAEIADRFGDGDEADEEEIDETAEPFEPEAEVELSNREPSRKPPFARPVPGRRRRGRPTPAPRRAPRAALGSGRKAKAAFTLRLDPIATSSCASPAPSTAARRSSSSPTRSTSC